MAISTMKPNPDFLTADGQPITEQVTEEVYEKMLGTLPPIYFKAFNFIKVFGGFAPAEPYCHLQNGIPVYRAYFKDDAGIYRSALVAFHDSDRKGWILQPAEYATYSDALLFYDKEATT